MFQFPRRLSSSNSSASDESSPRADMSPRSTEPLTGSVCVSTIEESTAGFGQIIGYLCNLFCCPPTRSSIVRKIAFQPPLPPTYTIVEDSKTETGWQLQFKKKKHTRLLKRISVYKVPRKGGPIPPTEGATIALIKIPSCKKTDSKYTILYSHPNASDIGQGLPALEQFAYWFDCDIFTYDYTGYGSSKGVPSEENLIQNSHDVLDYITDELGVPIDEIVLLGESIGSVPTVHLSCRHPVRGAILQGALASGVKLLFPSMDTNLFGLDCLRNIDFIHDVKCPVLFVHGTRDELVPLEHAKQLAERCPTAVEPLWVVEGGHSDLPSFSVFRKRLRKFIHDRI